MNRNEAARIGGMDRLTLRDWVRRFNTHDPDEFNVRHKQHKRSLLLLADGSRIRLRPQHPNQVWSYDFVEDCTHDGRKYRVLNVIEELTRECRTIGS